MTHLVEYVLCSNRSLMVRISECISGRTRVLYSAFIKMDCKSCPLYLLLMGPLSILCIVNSCNATGCIIKPWYLHLSLKHRISFYLLQIYLQNPSIYSFYLSVFLSLSFYFFPPFLPFTLFLSSFFPSLI